MGRRKIKIDKSLRKKAESLAAQGLTREQIAISLGMGESTLYEKIKEYPEFLEAIQAGKAKGIATVTNALFSKCKDGDVTAMKYYLNNRDNDNWKYRIANSHSGPNGGPMEIQSVTRVIIDASDDPIDSSDDP